MTRWTLLAADGRVLEADLQLQPPALRRLLDDADANAPHNAPHFVALAGGDPA